MFPEGPAGHRETVRYPDLLRELGRTCESDWRHAAQDEVNRVRSTLTEPHHFGGIPAARQFAAVYRAAQHVYEETLVGLRADLEAAGAALRAAAESMADIDEASADAFQQLQARWGGGAGMDNTTQHLTAESDATGREGARAKDDLEGASGAGSQARPEDATTTTDDGSAPVHRPADPGMTTGG